MAELMPVKGSSICHNENPSQWTCSSAFNPRCFAYLIYMHAHPYLARAPRLTHGLACSISSHPHPTAPKPHRSPHFHPHSPLLLYLHPPDLLPTPRRAGHEPCGAEGIQRHRRVLARHELDNHQARRRLCVLMKAFYACVGRFSLGRMDGAHGWGDPGTQKYAPPPKYPNSYFLLLPRHWPF